MHNYEPTHMGESLLAQKNIEEAAKTITIRQIYNYFLTEVMLQLN